MVLSLMAGDVPSSSGAYVANGLSNEAFACANIYIYIHMLGGPPHPVIVVKSEYKRTLI